jgi:formyl-CoA transferase
MFADPQVKHLRMARAIKHPKLGDQEVIGQAINMSRTKVDNWTATPEQGEHTESILKEFGYDAGAIDGFKKRGVI